MKLYEMTQEYEKAFDILSEIENLDIETIENTLMPLSNDIKNKSINVASYIKNLQCEISLIKDYIENMNNKKRYKERKIEAIKDYLRFNMEKSGITKIDSPEFTILLGAEDISTDIYDSSVLPINYCRKVERYEPDKLLIKEAIEKGNIIDGARLIKKKRLIIK